MNAARFDALLRVYAAGATRRGIVRALAGGALGAALARLGAGEAAAAKCRKPIRRCQGRKQCCGWKQGRTTCRPLQADFCGPTHPGKRCCVKAGFPSPADGCGCCSGFIVAFICRLECTAAADCPQGQQCCPIGPSGYCAASC